MMPVLMEAPTGVSVTWDIPEAFINEVTLSNKRTRGRIVKYFFLVGG